MTDNSREGWTDHDGGPNPIPGQWANIRQRGYADQDDQIWEADFQQWRFKDYDPQPWDIIAYRIVTAADDLGDGNEAACGVVTSKPDELAIAVERVLGNIALAEALAEEGDEDEDLHGLAVVLPCDLRLILSRLAGIEGLLAAHKGISDAKSAIIRGLEETIRADGAAFDAIVNECPATCETSPAHSMADIAAARLSARQDPPA